MPRGDALFRFRALVPALWGGVLLCIAVLAAPAAFAALAPPEAGKVVGRLFEREAYLSLVLALLMVLLERRAGSPALGANVLLALGALFSTVAGYFALEPWMSAARAGNAPLSFGQLHALSVAFFGVKTLLVLALAWRVSRVRSS